MSLLNTVHVLGASQIFLVALYVYLRGRRRGGDRPGQGALLALLVVAGISISIGWLFASGQVLEWPWFSRTGFIGLTLTSALLVITVFQQRSGRAWSRRDLLLLLPALLLGLGLVPFWLSPRAEQAAYVRADILEAYQAPTLLFYYLSHGYGILILSGALFSFTRDPGPLPSGYRLRLKLYLGLFLITLLLSLVARVTDVFYSSGLGSTMSALLGIALGIDWLIVQAGSHPRYMELKSTRAPVRGDERVAERIREHFESERPYLSPEYRLTDLAHELELSITVLSRTISAGGLGRNFNDLVNRYRVQEVQRRLARPEYAEHTLLRIALDCGFNSKSSFNRIFRELTGESPGRFRRDRTEKQS